MRASLALSSALFLALAACTAQVETTPTGPAKAPGGGNETGSSSGGSGSSSGTASGSGSSSSGGSSSGGSGSGSSSGSSGGSSSGGTAAVTISSDTTWTDGMSISGSVAVLPGVTLTIASGATVTMPAGASITVQGTLKVASGATHAKLTGSSWGSLTIAAGGTLDADTLDISGATTGLDVAGTATWNDGVMTAGTPFKIEKGGSLTTTGSQATGGGGTSNIAGSFTASKLTYDRGPGEGIEMTDASAIFSAEDSVFHGSDESGGDMIISSAASKIHLAYDEIKETHCAFHFGGVTNFDVSYMNIHQVSYGFMLYGSDTTTGTRTISSSNFETLAAAGLDELANVNGTITASGNYFDSTAKIQQGDQSLVIQNDATSPVPGVGPR